MMQTMRVMEDTLAASEQLTGKTANAELMHAGLANI